MQTEKPELRPIDKALIDFLTRQFPGASQEQYELAGLISRQLADGNLCLPTSCLQQEADRFQLCQASLQTLIDQNPLVSQADNTPLIHDQERLYLSRYWQLECHIANAIKQRLEAQKLQPESLKAPLADLFPAEDEKALNGETNWQKVACTLAARSQFGIITGGPGTGKTTTVVKLLALLQHITLAETPNNPLTIRLAAPTGKAAARLSESINGAFERLRQTGISPSLIEQIPANVSTLHRLLGSRRDSRHFHHHRDNPLVADLVVVDEASMIDIDMMAALLDALPASCRLVLVGDKDQLASVEAGAVMNDLCLQADTARYDDATLAFLQASGCQLTDNSDWKDNQASQLSCHTTKLQKSWRAKDAAGILTLANAINQQQIEKADKAWQAYPDQLYWQEPSNSSWIQQHLIAGENGLQSLLNQMRDTRPENEADDDAINRWATGLLEKLGEQQLLTPLREGPDGLNALNDSIIKHLVTKRLFQGSSQQAIQHPGQPILVTSNLYDLGLMNGDMGLLLDHPTLGSRVAFTSDNNGIRWILPDQLEHNSQTGFAISVHQSQGSEYRRVLLYLPSQDTPLLAKELLYTAITRASKQFILLNANRALWHTATKRNTQRHSGLHDRLTVPIASQFPMA